jgi:hypothetical protein
MQDQSANRECGLTEAALKLGVSYVVAQRLMLTGALRGRKAGARYFVRTADVDRLARERRQADNSTRASA